MWPRRERESKEPIEDTGGDQFLESAKHCRKENVMEKVANEDPWGGCTCSHDLEREGWEKAINAMIQIYRLIHENDYCVQEETNEYLLAVE